MHTAPPTRLWFMDNLRVFLTVLVVAHHAAQPYGPTGGEWPLFNSERAAILGPFFAVNAAFFMGLFFFIAGYFLPGTGDRKGPKRLIQVRLQRFGIPILFFALIIFPPILYVLNAPPLSFPTFFIQVYVKQQQIEVAHLWFLMHLLCYTLLYGLWRCLSSSRGLHHSFYQVRIPGHGLIVIYLLGLSIVSFIVRIEYPIDRWTNLLGFIPAEIAHLPQYLSLFVLGVVSYRHNWLLQMPTARGLLWLKVGAAAALLRYFYSLLRTKGTLPGIIAGGGLDWRALVWSSWEAIICVGLCIGFLILFRERFNHQNSLLKMLSSNAYGVYLIHLLLILYIQILVADLAIAPLAKFGIVMFFGTPICFAVSALLRRITLVRLVIS